MPGLYLLNFHGTQAEKLSATTLYNLLKIAFAAAAGAGGVIALTTAYRVARAGRLRMHGVAVSASENQ